MIAKSLAVEIAGQGDRIYRCGRDEPGLPAQWRFGNMHKGDRPATFASVHLLEV